MSKSKSPNFLNFFLIIILLISTILTSTLPAQAFSKNPSSPRNSNPPVTAQKLVVVHDTLGQNWLADGFGNLGSQLKTNNYFASNIANNWGPTISDGPYIGDQIGYHNQVSLLWEWFRSKNSSLYLSSLYSESQIAPGTIFSRLENDPGGENSIILFTFQTIDSLIIGNPDDPPAGDDNPLRGGSEKYLSVSNIKGILIDCLEYFSSRQDKLFILTTIPAGDMQSNPGQSVILSGINSWLKNDWLSNYDSNNVKVFDLAAWVTSTSAGQNQTILQQATASFIPFLNEAYHVWKPSESVEILDPNNLQVSISGSTQTSIAISWTKSDEDILGYRVERSVNGGETWSLLASVSTKITSYSNQGLLCGVEYIYRIVPYNRSGGLTPSNSVSGMTTQCTVANPTSTTTGTPTETEATSIPPTGIPSPTKIATPTNTQVTANGVPTNPGNLTSPARTKTTISLAWQDQSNDEMGFKIERSKPGSSDWVLLGMVGSNTTSFTDTGLNCGQLFYYRVMAYNRFGNSPLSNILQIGTEICYPVSNTATSTPTGTLTLTNLPPDDPEPIALTPGKYDDTNTNLVYQGAWNVFTGRELYNQSSHFSDVIGSSVSANFIGTRLEIVYTAFSNRGVAEIYIDGQLLANLNQYSPSTKWQTVWVSPLLEQGTHDFQVIHSEGKLIDIDAVVISNEVPKPSNTPSKTASKSPSPSMTFTSTITATGTSTATKTLTATQTGTATKTNTPDLSGEDTKTPTSSPSPSATITHTITHTPTNTATQTFTPTGSSTTTLTSTITNTPSQSPTTTNTATLTPTLTLTATSTYTYTPSPSSSPTATFTKTVNSTPLQAGIYDDTHPSIYYQNNWNTMSARQLYNGTAHFSTGFGNSASFTFTGTRISLYYTAFSNKGTADIYIDGNFITELDQYAPSVYWQSKWDSPLLNLGVHEFTIIHTGGTMIDVDAVEISAETPKTPTPTLTKTSTSTPSPSASVTLTHTSTITHTATFTQTATVSQTAFSQTPTFTSTPSQTSTPSRTFTSTPTITQTLTHTPTSENPGLVDNDEWSNAAVIELENNTFSDSLNIQEATTGSNDPIISCLGETGNNSVWYSFNPAASGRLTLSTENSDFDTALAIWIENEGDLEALACNDHALDQTANRYAQVTTSLLPGFTYYIEVVSPIESPSGVLNLNAEFESFSPLTQGDYDDTNEKIIFLSGWETQIDENTYNQTLHTSNQIGATAGFYFDGERFDFLYSSAPSYGQIDIYIDGLFSATINQFSSESNYQNIWNSPVLDNSNHLVMLLHSGEGEVNLDGIFIDQNVEFLNPGIYDDTDELINYSAEGWELNEAQEAFNNTLHSSFAVGSSASWGFTGSQISILYTSYFTQGILDIFIDGILFDSLNQFSESYIYQNKWHSGKLSHGEHIVTLTHSQGDTVDIDGFYVDSSDPVPPGQYDDTDENVIYSGDWQLFTGSGPFNDSLHYSGTPGSTATLSFIGTQISLLYSAFPNRGTMDISIDGTRVTTINQYSPDNLWQQNWSSEILTPGLHTITFTHSSGALVDVDAIIVSGQGDNLIINPDFESGNVSPWEGIDNNNLVTNETHSGNYAVLIDGEEAYQRWIEVDPGKTYTYSAWFKWEEFSGDGWGYDRLYVNDSNFQEIAGINNLHLSYEPGSWHKVAVTFTPESDRVQVNFGIFGPQDNIEFYFDDLALFEKVYNTPPQVNPVADIQSGEVPLTVNFTANVSDIDGGISNVLWDFGDGSNSTELNPSHTYYQRGSYIVKLTAWDDENASNSDILSIEVSDSGSPVVNIESPTSGAVFVTNDTEIILQGTAIQSGSSINSLVWDNVSTDEAGIIQFAASSEINWQSGTIALKPGKNEILVTVTDSSGKISTDKVYINRQVAGPVISNVNVSASEVPLYEKYQITFDLQTVAENNFYIFDESPPAGIDPGTGVTAKAIILSPSGIEYSQPAFFTANVEYSGSADYLHFEETSDHYWQIRYTPQEIGTYSFSLYVQDASGILNTPIGTFTAVPSDNPGFVQVSEDDTRYFEFSNGEIFWPIGPANGTDYSDFKNSGLNFVRPWMAGTGAYSTNWARWISTAKEMGNEGFDSVLNYEEHYPSHELSQEIYYPEGQRIWMGWGNSGMFTTQLQAGTTYLVKLRVKTVNISGPLNASYPYGLMVKMHNWPTETIEQDLRPYASMIPEINTDRDWHTVVAEYTATSRDESSSYISIFLDNVSSGEIYIDQLSIKEIHSDGSLGGELIVNSSADMHTYVEPKAAAYFDWQVQQGEDNGVYFKYVVYDKRDWIPNHLTSAGIFNESGDGYYQPEGTKARWLQEQWWRYLAARWGYSTAVQSWELNNEGSPDSLEHYQTTQDFAEFLHENDAHPHLATTSFWCCWRPEFWGNEEDYPDVDYADIHQYSEDDLTAAYDFAGWQYSLGEQLLVDNVNKPIIRGETGISTSVSAFDYLSQPNPGIWYHNLLWAQLNESAMFDPNYWWSEHLSQIDQAEIAGPFAGFVHSLDLNKGGYTDLSASVSNSDLRLAGQKNLTTSKAHIWVQNINHTWRNVMQVDNPQTISPESGTITIGMSPNRTYTIEWWDTYTGELLSSQTQEPDSAGNLMLSISNLETDVALKIYPQVYTMTDTDWPTHAGGYERQGSVSDAPSTGTLNLQWKRFLGERIEVEMEPIIVGDLLYIGLMNGKMYALDKNSGETAWVFNSGMGITNSPSVAAASSGLMIYFGSSNGNVYALDALSGQQIWSFSTSAAIMSTPAFVNEQVFVGSLDGVFYALDANTGDLNWSYDTGSPISTSPAIGGQVKGSQSGIYFANGSNMAYGFSEDGSLIWSNQMQGLFTKRTYAVYANDVVMFVTRKPGQEYAEPANDLPENLQGGPQPAATVVSSWADYYLNYPQRRTLYYYDTQTGSDLWMESSNKSLYTPMYIPYWGEYMPVVDDSGFAWFAASGSGGDHALGHDFRLWKINLQTGEYTQLAGNDEFLARFDEVGRPTLAGTRLYMTISEDVTYYDASSDQINSSVFGNGVWNHRKPIELDEMTSNEIFGGWYKYFTRFGGSTPAGFGGANDAASPLVISGDNAYYVAWGHLYALTTSYASQDKDFGQLDIADTPNKTLTRQEAAAELNQSIQYIVDNNIHIEAASRLWSWYPTQSFGSFWHEGEVLRSLAETLPYLDQTTSADLKTYLSQEIEDTLLSSDNYEYERVCLNFDTNTLQDPCLDNGINIYWFKDNEYHMMENLFAIYKYAELSGDEELVLDNWSFIKNIYGKYSGQWDQEAGFFLPQTWHAGEKINFNTQITAMLAVREMASMANDSQVYSEANTRLNRMYVQRVYWGNFVRNLYTQGQLSHQNYEEWESWGYWQYVAPIPVEGYMDETNDYRQVFSITRNDQGLDIDFDSPSSLYYPYALVGFHPLGEELGPFLNDNFEDILTDYINAIERIVPFWYMGDYAHAVVVGNSEDDSLSPILAADIFQTKAYVFGQSFEELAPYLPWIFEDYGPTDVFRIQNLTALLSAP